MKRVITLWCLLIGMSAFSICWADDFVAGEMYVRGGFNGWLNGDTALKSNYKLTKVDGTDFFSITVDPGFTATPADREFKIFKATSPTDGDWSNHSSNAFLDLKLNQQVQINATSQNNYWISPLYYIEIKINESSQFFAVNRENDQTPLYYRAKLDAGNYKIKFLKYGLYYNGIGDPVSKTEWDLWGVNPLEVSISETAKWYEFTTAENAISPNNLSDGANDVTLPSTHNGVITNQPKSIRNLIIQDGAKLPTLTNELFVAGTIIYERKFDVGRQWYDISLPYHAVKTVVKDTQTEIKATGAGNGDYWLREYDNSKFINTLSDEGLLANKGYIMMVPKSGTDDGEKVYENQTIQFISAPELTISISEPATPTNPSDGYTLNGMGSYDTKSLTNVYVLNETGTAFEKQNSVTLNPFRAYVLAQPDSQARSLVITDGTTGIENNPSAANNIKITTNRDEVTIEATSDSTVRIFTTTGQFILNKQLAAGSTIQVTLSAGIYIVNGIKIVIL